MGVHLHLDIVGGVHVVPDSLFELIGRFAQFSLIFFWNGNLIQCRREHPHDAFWSELQTVFLARKLFCDFAELLFGQRRGLLDMFRSVPLHFGENLAEAARDVLDFIRIDRTLERLRFLHSAANGGHILRVSLTMFQHETAHGVVHLILRGNAGSQTALLIERDLTGQLCKFRIFQKLTDH